MSLGYGVMGYRKWEGGDLVGVTGLGVNALGVMLRTRSSRGKGWGPTGGKGLC